jgi:hypothetical protein
LRRLGRDLAARLAVFRRLDEIAGGRLALRLLPGFGAGLGLRLLRGLRRFFFLRLQPGRPLAVALGLPVALGLTLAVLRLGLLALGVDLALRLGQHSQVMLSMLGKILGGDAVARQLRVAVQLVVFLDDLLRRAAHLSVRARTVEHAVDDIATGGTVVVAVLVAARA